MIEAGLLIGGGLMLWQHYEKKKAQSQPANDPLVNVMGPLIPSSRLLFEAGWDEAGRPVMVDLADMPHLLVAGMTGSGKSTFISVMLVDLLTTYSPEQMKLVLIDPKRVELTPFASSRHTLSFSYEVDDSITRLKTLCVEMERRYAVLAATGVRKVEEILGMPRIVVVVEELANLMLSGRHKEVEAILVRLASMGRAVGIHLVLITQRPSVDVITGVLKANIPARTCLATVTAIDSRVVLDRGGAERLEGKGDLLLMLPGERDLWHLRGRQVADVEITWATHKW